VEVAGRPHFCENGARQFVRQESSLALLGTQSTVGCIVLSLQRKTEARQSCAT